MGKKPRVSCIIGEYVLINSIVSLFTVMASESQQSEYAVQTIGAKSSSF